MTGSQTGPPPHAWATWELKEKAKQILVIGRNYCQPVLWSRASLLEGQTYLNANGCRRQQVQLFKFNFAFRLGCLSSNDLPVYAEIRTVPQRVPLYSMCLLSFSLSVMLRSNGQTKFMSRDIPSTSDFKRRVISFVQSTPTYVFPLINRRKNDLRVCSQALLVKLIY